MDSEAADRAFSWYPGHMVKAKRELESNLKLADAVLLMLDARAPTATRHPELEEILAQRYTPFVLVLNKTDLALHVGADLDIMLADTIRMRGPADGKKPFAMTNLKTQAGLQEVIAFIETRGMLKGEVG